MYFNPNFFRLILGYKIRLVYPRSADSGYELVQLEKGERIHHEQKSKVKLLLTASLVLSVLSACANQVNHRGDSTGSPGAVESSSSPPAVRSSVSTKTQDPLGKYAEHVTVTVVRGYNPPDSTVSNRSSVLQAWEYANTRKGYWRTSKSPILSKSLENNLLKQLGFLFFADYYRQVTT